jgi:hypothetical protein
MRLLFQQLSVEEALWLRSSRPAVHTLRLGLVTGHPNMPEFMFEVHNVGAILATAARCRNHASPDNHHPVRQ